MSELPRQYHFVWMGGPLPYVAELAIGSVLGCDSAALVTLHLIGDVPDSPALNRLGPLPRVTLVRSQLGEVFAPLGALGQPSLELLRSVPNGAFSAMSNLIRYALLHQFGGIYLDTDTFLVHPLHQISDGQPFVGAEWVWEFDQARVEGRYQWWMAPRTVWWSAAWFARRADSFVLGGSGRLAERIDRRGRRWSIAQPNNAVIGAPSGSEFTAALLEQAPLQNPAHRYALGPSLLARTLADRPGLARVLEPEWCYAVPPADSFRFFEDRRLILPEHAAVVHYVSSNHRQMLDGVEPGDQRLNERDEVFWRLAGAAAESLAVEGQLGRPSTEFSPRRRPAPFSSVLGVGS